MIRKIAYEDRKDDIRTAILKRARERRTLTYGELGLEVDIPAIGPWKPILDLIGHEERNAGRPDMTVLVVSKVTGLPSQIDFVPSRKPTAEQKARVRAEFERVWDRYARNA